MKVLFLLLTSMLLHGCVVVPGPIGVVGEYGAVSVQPPPIYVDNGGYGYNNVYIRPPPVYRENNIYVNPRPIYRENNIYIRPRPIYRENNIYINPGRYHHWGGRPPYYGRPIPVPYGGRYR